MKHLSQLIFLLLFAPLTQGAINYYVATNGNDSNPGSLASPFATLTKARDQVRTLVSAGLTDHIIIHVRGGIYRLESPLTLTTQDSGTTSYSITWRGYGTEIATITSERALGGTWINVSGNLWKLNIPDVATGAWRFRTLSVFSQKSQRAHEPDAGWFTLTAVDSARKVLTLDQDLPSAWSSITGAEINTTAYWHYNRQALASINGSADTVTSLNNIGSDASSAVIGTNSHSRIWLENALEFVDEPGEWFLNTTSGDLYYQVVSGDAHTRTYDAPTLTTLVTVRGTSNSNPVTNVKFVNLVFRGTDWDMTAQERRGVQAGAWSIDSSRMYSPPAAVIFEYAQGCGVTDSRFNDLGEGAIALERGSRNTTIDGNIFTRVGANVIQVARIPDYVGVGHPLHYDYPDAGDAPTGNIISDNEITDSCDADFGSVGILVGYANYTTITRNRLANLPYTAISVGWRWATGTTNCHNNTISYNLIDGVMEHCGDGGAIYLVGEQPGTKVLSNYVRLIGGNYWSHGIYPDEQSNFLEIAYNYVQGPADYSIFQHKNLSSLNIHDNNGEDGTTGITGTTATTKWTIFNPERTPTDLSIYGPNGASNLLPLARDFDDGSVTGWEFDAEGSSKEWNVIQQGSTKLLQNTATSAGSRISAFGARDWQDVVAIIDIESPTDVTGAYPALLFRMIDGANFYMLQLRMGENAVRLYKRVGGIYTQLGSDVATTLNANTTYEVKAEVQGSEIKTYIDGVLKQSAADAALAWGRVGMRSYGSAARFDNLNVTSLASTPNFDDDFEGSSN